MQKAKRPKGTIAEPTGRTRDTCLGKVTSRTNSQSERAERQKITRHRGKGGRGEGCQKGNSEVADELVRKQFYMNSKMGKKRGREGGGGSIKLERIKVK